MWRDGPEKRTTCPVRCFTPEVRELLAWFERTHTLRAGMVGMWEPLAGVLPRPGSAGEQDARLMACLDFIRDMKNGLMHETRSDDDEGGAQEQVTPTRTRRAAKKRRRGR